MKAFPIVLSACAAFWSCTEVETESALTARATVEGYLIPGSTISVQVKREYLFGDDDSTAYLNDLDLVLYADDEPITLQLSDTGTYVADRQVVAGVVYRLSFTYEGKAMSAETNIPTKPEGLVASDSTYQVPTFTPGSGSPPEFPEPLLLTWQHEAGDYYLVVVRSTETDPTEINSSSFRPPFRFRSEPIQAGSYQIRPQEFQYYGSHDIILFHITADYAALYQNNGSSSLSIKTPYSNIKNGLGIFTGAHADTLHLEVTKP